MSTITQSLVYDASSLANFTATFKTGLSDVLVAAGWTRTSDTGQINWASYSLPATDAQTLFEIFQTPADGLTPYYVKICYSRTSGSLPEFYLQIGSATDGAGNLTGFTSTNYKSDTTAGTSPGAASLSYYACYDGSSVAILMARDHTQPSFICLERSRDASGAYTSSYLTAFLFGANTVASGRKFQQSMIGGSGAAQMLTEFAVLAQVGATTAAGGGYTGVFPAMPCIPYADYPSLFVGQMASADIGEAATFTDTMYGATHTFFTFGNGNAAIGQGKTSGVRSFMRWE